MLSSGLNSLTKFSTVTTQHSVLGRLAQLPGGVSLVPGDKEGEKFQKRIYVLELQFAHDTFRGDIY